MSDHPIVHVEIPAADVKAASQFYADVFGWQIDHSMEEYPMFAAEGGPGGGFTKLGDPGHTVGRPLIYLATDDIEASLAAVEAHGGKTLEPKMEIPHVGWFAIFADPAGNAIALYTSIHQQPSETGESHDGAE